MPTSHEEPASTARQEPSLIAITTSKPRFISTTVCLTSPPSMQRAPPWVRLASPEAMAASWSALGRSRRSEAATGSPSADTTSAWATPGVWLAKLPTSQLKSLASLLSVGMAVLTLWRPGHSRAAQDGRRPAGLDPGRRPGGRTTATLVAGSILRTWWREHAEFLDRQLAARRTSLQAARRNLDRLRIRVGSGTNPKVV